MEHTPDKSMLIIYHINLKLKKICNLQKIVKYTKIKRCKNKK